MDEHESLGDLAPPALMLSQQTRIQPGQSEYRARWPAASGGIPWLVIPLHQIGVYQQPHHAGVQMSRSAAGTAAEIG